MVMHNPIDGFDFGGRISDALGLEHTTRIEIIIPLEGPVEIHAEMYMTDDKAKNVEKVLRTKRFYLCEANDDE